MDKEGSIQPTRFYAKKRDIRLISILQALSLQKMRFTELVEYCKKNKITSRVTLRNELRYLKQLEYVTQQTDHNDPAVPVKYTITPEGEVYLGQLLGSHELIAFKFDPKTPQGRSVIFSNKKLKDRLYGLAFLIERNRQQEFGQLLQWQEGVPSIGKVQGFASFLVRFALERALEGKSIPGPNEWNVFLEVLKDWEKMIENR